MSTFIYLSFIWGLIAQLVSCSILLTLRDQWCQYYVSLLLLSGTVQCGLYVFICWPNHGKISRWRWCELMWWLCLKSAPLLLSFCCLLFIHDLPPYIWGRCRPLPQPIQSPASHYPGPELWITAHWTCLLLIHWSITYPVTQKTSLGRQMEKKHPLVCSSTKAR